jgi:hypothetical protein
MSRYVHPRAAMVHCENRVVGALLDAGFRGFDVQPQTANRCAVFCATPHHYGDRLIMRQITRETGAEITLIEREASAKEMSQREIAPKPRFYWSRKIGFRDDGETMTVWRWWSRTGHELDTTGEWRRCSWDEEFRLIRRRAEEALFTELQRRIAAKRKGAVR